MRNIGVLPTEEQATDFSGALYLRGIENDVESEEDGSFSIWVHDDNKLNEGRDLLARFRENPGQFGTAAYDAAKARARAEKADREQASNVITRERLDYERGFNGSGWVWLLLMVASLAVAAQSGTLLSEKPSSYSWLNYLFISRYLGDLNLSEVFSGEVWRLITPIFIHFGPIHLIFNMLWLREFGNLMETRFSSLYFIAFVLAIAAVSNLVQNSVSGPSFGGMSGVNYGLFGFLWMRSRFDRRIVWRLNPATIQMLIIWFFVCLTGLLGSVANAAHAAGLIAGGLWGYLSSLKHLRR